MSMEVIQKSFAMALRDYQAQRYAQAEALCQKILAFEPAHADALHLLGMIAYSSEHPEDAIDLIQQAIALDEKSAEYFGSLGLVLASINRIPEAIAAYERAIALKPDFAEIYYNLGIAYRVSNQPEKALAAYRRAIEILPKFSEAFNNYGHELRKAGRFEEAIEAYSRAIAIKPTHIEARNNLGVSLDNLGRLDEAIECYREALKINPQHSGVHSNLVYTLHFHPKWDAEEILREHRRWNELHAKSRRAGTNMQAHENDRSANRRLKIGYVSPDFREHCQAMFTVPLLSHHDHDSCEIFCYSDVPMPDAVTTQLQGYADCWRNINRKKDEDVAQLIREDQIDILVDLTMHMANNRLLVFARNPAPVQVSWLAYPGTSGLDAIDYRLTDPYLDPPGRDHFYSEKSVRLPDSFWCYDPRISGIEVNELPALKNGFITFGCLNNFCKINEPVLQMWAEVLRAVPSAKLKLLAPRGECRERLLEKIAIEPRRIEFVDFRPRGEYLKLYHGIDLCIDTFPYNGHTTSLDSLWMGVPVVSLCGTTVVSRAGFSQSSNLGLTELVA
ncbi:MAG TPA: tetratricopeptide repeat protein, partial [Tepidisphaeraceae bacterium]|nr:tetratricopeptide repeat protein [Tepidisphaeraceae bacterium]